MDVEREHDEAYEINKPHLTAFAAQLKKQDLSEKTIQNHMSNVDFYINDFLYYYHEDKFDIRDGCRQISSFLGDWFIRKAMWSSRANIKSSAASIKKFYACMLEIGVVNQEDYDELCGTIKVEMDDWLENMSQYDNMDDEYF